MDLIALCVLVMRKMCSPPGDKSLIVHSIGSPLSSFFRVTILKNSVRYFGMEDLYEQLLSALLILIQNWLLVTDQ
jgi:hypothetical protein